MILAMILAGVSIYFTIAKGQTSTAVLCIAVAVFCLATALNKKIKETESMIYGTKQTIRGEVDRMITSRIEESKNKK